MCSLHEQLRGIATQARADYAAALSAAGSSEGAARDDAAAAIAHCDWLIARCDAREQPPLLLGLGGEEPLPRQAERLSGELTHREVQKARRRGASW